MKTTQRYNPHQKHLQMKLNGATRPKMGDTQFSILANLDKEIHSL